MNNTNIHPRYTEIEINNRYSKKKFAFIIFNQEQKLRSHIMEHFLDTKEWNSLWEKINQSKSYDSLTRRLNTIGCPYFTQKDIGNKHKCQRCQIFNTCSNEDDIITIQREYINIIIKLLEEILEKPRFAKFFSKEENKNCIAAFHDRSVKVFSAETQNSIYNVTTAFAYKPYCNNLKFGEILHNLKKEIIAESKGRPEWYSKETWRIDNDTDYNKAYVIKRKFKMKKYNRENIYWKKFLEDENGEY